MIYIYIKNDNEYLITNLAGNVSGWYSNINTAMQQFNTSHTEKQYKYLSTTLFLQNLKKERPEWDLINIFTGTELEFKQNYPEYFI